MSELSDLLTEWSLNPAIVLPLVLSAGLYARGYSVMASNVRRGTASLNATRNSERTESEFPAKHEVTRVGFRSAERRRLQALFFSAGWIALALSLLSPLHALSEVLFSMHMVQHELLMTLAAPLLIMGRPFAPMLWALPHRWRKGIQSVMQMRGWHRAQHVVTLPSVGWIVYGLTLWIWHAPTLFQFALQHEFAHALQHACFLLAAFLFWNGMLLHRAVARQGVAILYLFTTAVHTSVLGALITFDSTLWYPFYGRTALTLGVAPLADQRWAGLIMWIPGSVPYMVATLWLVVRWMRDSRNRGWAPTEVIGQRALG